MLALTALAHDRSLPQSVVLSAIQFALEHSYKKDANGQEVRVDLNPDTGDTVVRTIKIVVDQVEDEDLEISLSQAQGHYPDITIGEEVTTGYIEPDPGRITAQTSRQLLLQKLREAERQLVADEYSDRIGEVMAGTVQRLEGRDVIVSLGRGEAVMPLQEQVSAEKYRVGQQLKFIISKLDPDRRGPEVIVSRSNLDLLQGLFEIEVPEINTGVIEIKNIVREAGSRSKIAVFSNQEGIDAVGACVGLRGLRIQNVVNELLGEKIDIIEWSEDPVEFIIKSLSPSDVEAVKLNAADKSAQVVVPENQLSLAIGKDGQNVRLAARLCGWKVDIQSASSNKEVSKDATNTELSKNGIDINTEEILKVAGISTVNQIKEMDDKDLLEVAGMTEKRLKEVRSQIPSTSSIKLESIDEDNKAKVEELAKKIVDENEVFSQEDIVEIVESSSSNIEMNTPEPNEKDNSEEVKEDDIWNIDSIVKKKSKKSNKGVIRFAEDIEDLKS
jgi:N utilization substance protein A